MSYLERIPPRFVEALQRLIYQVKNEDLDILFIIDGSEGSGKSQTARLVGAAFAEALGTPFSIDNVHYGVEEYMKASDRMGQNTVHILDEAGVILDRSASNTRLAKKFTRYMQVARGGNNQVHIMVLPAYHILNQYLVNWRCRFVLHMYTEDYKAEVQGGYLTKRGAFKVFKRNQQLTEMSNLYMERKIFVYPKQWYLHERMPNVEPFTKEDLDAINEKKNLWRTRFVNGDEDEKERKSPKKDKILQVALNKLSALGVPQSVIAKDAGVDKKYVWDLSRKGGG